MFSPACSSGARRDLDLSRHFCRKPALSTVAEAPMDNAKRELGAGLQVGAILH